MTESTSDTNEASQDFQSGRDALLAGRAGDAVAPLHRFVLAQPDNFDGNNFLGVALAQRGQPEDAIRFLQKAVSLNPQNAPAQYNLGLAYLGARDVVAARSSFEAAARVDPAHSGARDALERLASGTASGADVSASGAMAPDATVAAVTAITTSPNIVPAPIAPASEKPGAVDVARAFGLGLLAAILAAIAWDKFVYYTNYQIGLVAVGVGFAVGYAVAAGGNGKRGRSLQIVGALLACFAMLLGQALIVMDQGRDYFLEQGITPNPVTLFIFSAALVPRVIADDPLTLLFIAIGIWEGWKLPGEVREETQAPPAQADHGSAQTP